MNHRPQLPTDQFLDSAEESLQLAETFLHDDQIVPMEFNINIAVDYIRNAIREIRTAKHVATNPTTEVYQELDFDLPNS